MKRILALLTAALLAAGMLTGCGDKTAGESGTDSLDLNIDKTVSATLRIGIRNEAAEETLMKTLCEGFKKQYPNIKTEIERISDYEATIMGNVVAGEAYDILWAADQNVTFLANNNIIYNLDDFIKESGFDTSKYYDSLMKLGKKNHKESQYMMPRDYSRIVTYINKKVFREAGVEVPGNDWTWDDFTKVSQKLKAHFGESASRYALDARFDWLILAYGFTSSFGGQFLNEDGTGNFDANFQKGLEVIRDTVVTNGFCLEPLQYTSSGQLFLAGNAGMWFETRAKLSSAATMIGADLQVLPMPAIGDTPKAGAGTTGYAIASASKNKAVAWKFLEYMMSEEGQELMSKTGDLVPSLKSLADKKDAAWRTVPGMEAVNHDAFILYDERDVIQDYFDNVPAKLTERYRSTMESMLQEICKGKKVGVATAFAKQEIEEILASQ